MAITDYPPFWGCDRDTYEEYISVEDDDYEDWQDEFDEYETLKELDEVFEEREGNENE